MQAILLVFVVFISLGNGWAIAQQPRIGYKEKGVASYYEERFDGRSTPSGEKFDNSELVASHRRIPFNTKVKVTNLENKQWVIVRIIDRGPYAHGRIIDVSLAAAKKLDLLTTAVALVEIEVLSPEGKTLAEVKEEEEKNKELEEKNANTEGLATKISNTPTKNANNKIPALQDSDFQIGKTYNIWGSVKKPQGIGIQIASLDSYAKVQNFLKQFENQDIGDIYIQIGVNNTTKKKTFRILINEYENRTVAERDLINVRKLTKLGNTFTFQAHQK